MKNQPYPRHLSKEDILIISQAQNLKQSALEIEHSAYSMAGLIDTTIVGELMLLSAQIERIGKKLNRESASLEIGSNQPELSDQIARVEL